jgi:hypothetical protein
MTKSSCYIVALCWAAPIVRAQAPCTVTSPTTILSIPHVPGNPGLILDPHDPVWGRSSATSIDKDCSRVIAYPDIRTDVRAFWTDTHLYFLFQCPYKELNIFLPASNDKPRLKLWDRDVVEIFLGDDWENIRHYREFEIAPTGDWIDLAIDLDHKSYDHSWRSGWNTAARVDHKAKVWYAAARIPLRAVTTSRVSPGARFRMNLYRIEGLGPDTQRHFLCWQPTCVQNRDPNHVPENFGTLVFEN